MSSVKDRSLKLVNKHIYRKIVIFQGIGHNPEQTVIMKIKKIMKHVCLQDLPSAEEENIFDC